MNKYILDTLKVLDIPVYFVSRDETQLPMVIYNFSEKGWEYADDKESATLYKVTVNIFSNGNYLKYKKQIIQLMEQAGFTKDNIPTCIYMSEFRIFNQPMVFNYVEYKKA